MDKYNPFVANEADETGKGILDFVLQIAQLFAVIGMTALLFLADPQQSKSSVEKEALGAMLVELHWPDDKMVDLDLWCKAPGDAPVGYLNKAGLIFNLLRDDLGAVNDLTGKNYETSFTRGLPPGKYIINVVLYRRYDIQGPIPFKVVVSIRQKDGTLRQALVRDMVFDAETNVAERTVFRFDIDESGELVRDSVDSIYNSLFTLKEGAM